MGREQRCGRSKVQSAGSPGGGGGGGEAGCVCVCVLVCAGSPGGGSGGGEADCECAGGPGGGGGGGKADCVCVCAGRCKRARAVDLEFVCTQHPILQELGGLAVGADVRVAVQTIHGRLAAAQVNVLGYLWMLCSICRK